MRFLSKATLLLYLFFCVGVEVLSQSNISFGKVSMEELKMTRYEGDTTAGAVILSDIGKLDGNKLRFTRHIRVKVLKKSGLRWGDWVFNTPVTGDFKVAVYNLNGGEVVKEKVGSESIFHEEVVSGFYVYKVFAPNVRVGSVIDIFYWYVGVPFEWRFQEIIPVAYSELTLEPSNGINFTKTAYGLERLEILSPYHWRAKNMPAFIVEPYLNNYANYITKFSIQLVSLWYSNSLHEFSTSWRQINDYLYRSNSFGGVLEGSRFLNEPAQAIKEKKLPVDKAIGEAYAFIQKNAKWNGVKSMYATSNFKANFETNHSCNSAEINLALIVLLNKIGINTVPLVLSTRDNGLIAEHSPAISSLNYVVGYVDHENTNMLLDATSEFAAPGILPAYCLNGNGLMVKRDNEQWFTLVGKNKEAKAQYTEVTINKDGEAVAAISRDFSGYAFLDWADNLKSNNGDPETIKNQLQKENPKIKIEKYEVVSKNKDLLKGRDSFKADVSDQFIDAGDEYLLNPFVFFEYAENPFKSETRKNPVDWGCPKEFKSTIVVKIPDDFQIKQIPPSTRFSTSDGTASFIFLANSTPGKLEYMTLIKFSKYIFTEVEYLELREFFSQIIKVVNTPVTLSKKT